MFRGCCSAFPAFPCSATQSHPKPPQNHTLSKILSLEPQGFAVFFQKTFKKGVDILLQYAVSYNHGRGQHPTDTDPKGGGAMTKRAAERTSYEVRRRWDTANLKTYTVRLNLKNDAALIEYIDSKKDTVGTSNLFREALELHIANSAGK